MEMNIAENLSTHYELLWITLADILMHLNFLCFLLISRMQQRGWPSTTKQKNLLSLSSLASLRLLAAAWDTLARLWAEEKVPPRIKSRQAPSAKPGWRPKSRWWLDCAHCISICSLLHFAGICRWINGLMFLGEGIHGLITGTNRLINGIHRWLNLFLLINSSSAINCMS